MSTRRVLAVVASLVLAATVVSGCGDDSGTDAPPTPKKSVSVAEDGAAYDPIWEFSVVETPYGSVECMYASTGVKSGGPSCNWEKFNQTREDTGDSE